MVTLPAKRKYYSMKPIYSVILFVVLMACAATSGIHRYRCAEDSIVADMNQALARTLAVKQDAYITPDTISNYRSHLKIEALRHTSLLSYADDRSRGLKSRKMMWSKDGRQSLAFQGYANCNAATVLALSDQRLPAALSLMALLWAAMSAVYFRRQRRNWIVIGGLALDNDSGRFLLHGSVQMALTPMQQRLMTMLFRADGHQLGKQQIQDALWPKKPDASETLYTLIKRIKPVIARGGLTITTGRGKDYRLTRIEYKQ